MKLDSVLRQFLNVKTTTAALVFAASASVFLTYLIPQWYSFFTSKVFVFTNGWDEEWYLSWQGVELGKGMVGTYSLHLFRLMHIMGISGAVQNLLFDTLLPPATAFMVYLSLRKYQLPAAKAAGYATLICFGSVLFNANNPLISLQLGETRTAAVWFMSAWEVYPSILRTPNPQISFFLISVAVYGYVRFSKWWFLILPLPVMYFYTAITYVFVLFVSLAYAQIRLRFKVGPYAAAFCATFVTFVLAGLGLVAAMTVNGLYQPDNPIRKVPYLFIETRQPQFPVGMLALVALLGVGMLTQSLRLERRQVVPLLILAATSLGVVNLHAFTGFMLSQKNYYDYGLSVIFPLALVIVIGAIRWELVRGLVLVAMLISVATLCYRSQKIWFAQAKEYSFKIAPGIERLREDPLRAIIPDWNAAGRAAYSTPRLLSPLSYIYFYAINECVQLPGWAANAVDFERTHLAPGSRELAESMDVARQIFDAQKRVQKPASNFPYCADVDFEKNDFFIVGPK